MADYWLTYEELQQCDHILYRVFCHEFQDDVWDFAYKSRVYGEDEEYRSIVRRVFGILRKNKNFFLSYCDNDDEQIIRDHMEAIRDGLKEMSDTLKTHREGQGTAFTAETFLRGLEMLIKEYT